jgi:hypothetical protein
LRGDRIVRQHVENQVNEVARWGSFEEIGTALGREKDDAALAATVRIPSVEARKDHQAFDLPHLVSAQERVAIPKRYPSVGVAPSPTGVRRSACAP